MWRRQAGGSMPLRRILCISVHNEAWVDQIGFRSDSPGSPSPRGPSEPWSCSSSGSSPVQNQGAVPGLASARAPPSAPQTVAEVEKFKYERQAGVARQRKSGDFHSRAAFTPWKKVCLRGGRTFSRTTTSPFFFFFFSKCDLICFCHL